MAWRHLQNDDMESGYSICKFRPLFIVSTMHADKQYKINYYVYKPIGKLLSGKEKTKNSGLLN